MTGRPFKSPLPGLIADALDGNIPVERLRERRDELQGGLHRIYHAAPRTDGNVQDAPKNREDLTLSEEIDDMLPDNLRCATRWKIETT